MVLFVIIVTSGLIAIVLTLNEIVTGSTQQVAPVGGQSSSFDKATIERIEKLRTGDDAATPLDLSDGRTNPFVE